MKIFKLLSCILVAALLSAIGGTVIGSVFNIGAVIPAGVLFAVSMLPAPNGVLAINIFTAPGGAGVPFSWQLPYLPQFLSFTNAVALTSLRIETAEDGVLHDFSTAAIPAMANFMKVGTVTASQLTFRLADGELKRNVQFSGVTSAAGAVPFFISSEKKGQLAYKSKQGTCLAGVPTEFTKFTALFIPTMATGTDRAVITYSNGHVQSYNMEDLRDLSSIYQQVEGVIINNTYANISSVMITCAALTPVYILSVDL